MTRFRAGILAAVVVGFGALWVAGDSVSALAAQTRRAKSDAEIKQEIITQSLAAYIGSCPCPYNTDRRGRRCGGRSAYSRPGGASPLCYPGDVTQKMVEEYRVTRGEKRPAVERARRPKAI